MTRIITVMIICGFIMFFFFNPSFAGENDSDNKVAVPPGMEIIKSGDVNVLIPKGAPLMQIENVRVPQSAEEYTAGKVVVIERRLDRIEAELKALHDIMKEIRDDRKK